MVGSDGAVVGAVDGLRGISSGRAVVAEPAAGAVSLDWSVDVLRANEDGVPLGGAGNTGGRGVGYLLESAAPK